MIRGLITKMDNVVDTSLSKYLTKMELVEGSPFREFIFSLDSDHIGSCVIKGSRLSRDFGNTATAVCKRRFKWQDMVVMVVLDEEEEGEAGIVFTEKGIYHWKEDEEFVGEILYEDIAAVGYQGDSVIITNHEDVPLILFCGEDAEEEKYSRYMYNYICDVVEYFDMNVKGVEVTPEIVPETEEE